MMVKPRSFGSPPAAVSAPQTKAKEGTVDRRQREMDRRNAQRPWTDLKRRVDDICGPSHAADDVDVSELERPQRAESGVDIPPTVRVGSGPPLIER